MEVTPYALALIAGGFTVVGTLVGAFVTYRLAVMLARSNAKRDAGRRLREAFAPELAALDHATRRNGLDVEQLLQTAWPRHHAAVNELAVHLDTTRRRAFLDAWRKYYEVGGSIRFFDYYMGEQPIELFQQRVQAILQFAA
jgi:hypothetical protein